MSISRAAPRAARKFPSGPEFIHEVKYGDRVRLFSRNGNEWTRRYRWIVEAARKISQQRLCSRWRGRGLRRRWHC
jgi:ATP-dependent DNA ligase